jgi:hypothetical protein
VGNASNSTPVASFRGPLPTAFMTHNAFLSRRSATSDLVAVPASHNAILLPSGDHAAWCSNFGLRARIRHPLPSVLMTRMPSSSKAICFPSGD